MKPAPFSYHAPRTLAEALSLAAMHDNARVLAGGQSLMPMLNFRLAAPDHLIDIGRVRELVGIEETAAGLAIGAMTTQRMLERSPLVRARCPLLTEALEHVGHAATRNRGTIGGSLCHLDPSAEIPVVAMALEARLIIASCEGSRSIPVSELPAGYLTTQLAPNEILTSVELPALGERTGWAFLEMARRKGDFAIVAVALSIEFDAEDRVRRARIAIGGLGPSPVRAAAAEAALIGHRWEGALAARAGAAASALPASGDDAYPADYRRHLAGVLTRRALATAAERAKGKRDV
ncbi:MAG TPA: xanthine dehydrogenase family protein subunit M [Burkholderiales bacterium]|nr:xanthine dehydrogenase family protein subunit M [Burkholderiales bacterium]